ncbi:MAG: TonB-dependent receptor [bacterium]|nr:TonB-dependent receptor [bacterium]
MGPRRLDRAAGTGGPGSGERPAESWSRVDLGVGWAGGRWSLAAEVENLLDRTYHRHLSCARDPFAVGQPVMEPGRLLRLALAWSMQAPNP